MIVLSVATIILLWIGLLARDVLALRADVLALQDYWASLPAPIKLDRIDVPVVQQRVTSIHENLSALRSHAAPLLAVAPAFGWIPNIGGDIQAAPALIDLALQFTDIGDRALKAIVLFWPPPPSNGPASLSTIARILHGVQPTMQSFRTNIDRAGEIRQQIDSTKLSPRLRSIMDKFDAVYPSLATGVSLLGVAPQLLGADQPRTFLILLQNEDEIRPTGGFISAAGRITLDTGKIVSLTVEDSYQIDDFTKPYGDPPAPLWDYMGLQLWLFRDSNWSPDFPTAARAAIGLYTYTRPGAIDGVIALNQNVIEALATGLGPLSIDPAQPALTAQTVRAYMRAGWSPSGQSSTAEWMAQRKLFIGRLMQAILDRVLNNNAPIQWDQLGRALNAVLRGRDLMITFTDTKLNQPMAEAGWDGALQSPGSDYLMIVDANVGFNKANALIQEAQAYTITLSADGSAQVDLTMTYTHTGQRVEGCTHDVPNYDLTTTYDQLMQLCWWNYRRVYTPAGAQLIDATRHPTQPGELITGGTSDGLTTTSSELGKTVFSTLLIIGRGQHVQSRLRYSLPNGIMQADSDRRIYHLHLQKQSGAGHWPTTVTVVWPRGQRAFDAQPAPMNVTDHSAIFQFVLDADRDVRVVLSEK